ncbi:cytochrome P450 [Coniochaeta ligniaria NRRL 30616]|uniref:Cytochrome P450 n=1 Tax=Coniochaeta ligniaria NRRL 30616 TaxID=1408157 RepID=A0A1J7J447_9PEZI|nr:cytochrome P450 [Coniochaeta ligniaria NRRL 30616]
MAVTDAISSAPTSTKTLAASMLLLLLTRIFYGGSSRKKRVTELPFWVPLEIAATAYFITAGGIMGRILSLFRRNSGSVFGFTSAHQVLYDFKDVDRVMTKQYKNLEVFGAGWTLLVRVFGMSANKTKAEMDEALDKMLLCVKPLYRPVEQIFVGEQGANASVERADVPGVTIELVTFWTLKKDSKGREWSADVCVVAPDTAEANDLLDRNPRLLDDFWKFDNEVFPLLVIGVPTWLPVRAFQEGLAARARCNRAMEDCYRRIDQWQNGLPVDDGADMSDVSYIAQERNKIYSTHGMPVWARGRVDFSLLWGQNANSQALAFWFVAYIYSTPDLLPELRREVADFVKVDANSSPPRITSFDIPALSHSCPLLKSSLFETYRMANEATTIRYVRDAVTVEDGTGKQVRLRPDSWVSAPHGARQHDPAVYPEPHRFVPDRFLETDGETGRRVARYGRLKPWGSGHGMCKGRTLAEKEILAIAASVMSLWDMEPAGGEWKMPGMRMGTGVMCPTEDMRVVLRRRVFA